MLARGDLDRRDGARDGGVAEHVVRARRLFDPVGVELGQSFHVFDRVPDLPDLIRIHHQEAVRSDLLADDPRPAPVVLDLAADLQLHMRPAPGHGLAAQGP